MKPIKFLFIIFAVLILCSCSSSRHLYINYRSTDIKKSSQKTAEKAFDPLYDARISTYKTPNLEAFNAAGKIVLKPTKPTNKTYMTINDNLFVDKQSNIKAITVYNVPEGEYDIHYTSDNAWYKNELNEKISVQMKDKREVTKLIEVPPYGAGYWILFALLVIPGGIIIF